MDEVALTQALIRCPSVTPEDHGALDTLVGVLEPLGFQCTRLPFSENGTATVDNLYARLGTGTPYLCFAGHTDVVPVGDASAWSIPPFAAAVQGDVLIGRGAEDMKGAIACFVTAVRDFLAERGNAFTGSIGFIITGDEEGVAINGTRKMVEWMKERGEQPDGCIVGEPTNPEAVGDMVKIGRRGSMNIVLTVKGKQGHVAYPHLADNPITPLVRILHELKAEALDGGTDFFQPSNLEITSIDVGNPVKNVIPASAAARVNIRFNPLHDAEKIIAWVRGIASKHAQDFTLEMPTAWGAFITPPGYLSGVVSDAVKRATGRVPELSTTGGTSDARFLRDICPVVEFGTTGKTAHMVDECVKLADLRALTACYLETLRGFFFS